MQRAGVAEKSYYRWVVLGISYLLMVLFAFPLQSLPPLFPFIAGEIPFSYSQAGLLMGIYGLPGLFMPLAAAILASRYDQKKLTLAGLGIMIGGLVLFTCAFSFWMLIAGRLMAGVGAKIILSLAPLFIILFFEKKNLGVVVGIFNTAVPLGSIVAMDIFAPLGRTMGWRGSMGVIIAFALVMAAAVALFLYLPRMAGEKTGMPLRRDRLPRAAWWLAAVNLVVNVATLSYITFAPKFFAARGFAPTVAALLTSLIMVETAVLGPLVGWVVDRFDHRKELLVGGSAVMALCFPLLAIPKVPLALTVPLLGAGAAVVPVIVFPYLKDLLRPEQFGMGIAVLIIASNIGSTVGPPMFGWILDVSGFFAGFIALAAASLAIIPATLRIPARRPGDDPPPVEEVAQPEG